MGRKGHGIDDLSGFAMECIKEAGKQAMPFFGKGKPQVKFDQGMVTEADLRISDFFNRLEGGFYKVLKIVSLWAVLFGSKFVILGAIDRAFGDEVMFLGPLHGIVAFIVVVVTILLAEKSASKVNQMLGLIGKEEL